MVNRLGDAALERRERAVCLAQVEPGDDPREHDLRQRGHVRHGQPADLLAHKPGAKGRGGQERKTNRKKHDPPGPPANLFAMNPCANDARSRYARTIAKNTIANGTRKRRRARTSSWNS